MSVAFMPLAASVFDQGVEKQVQPELLGERSFPRYTTIFFWRLHTQQQEPARVKADVAHDVRHVGPTAAGLARQRASRGRRPRARG